MGNDGMRIAFLDRDGTINQDYPDAEWKNKQVPLLLPGTLEGLLGLQAKGYEIIILTNQYIIADGIITVDEYQRFHTHLMTMLESSGIKVLQTYYCPHGNMDCCQCIKPKPGMIHQALKDYPINLETSIYCGDSQCDYLLAQAFNLPFYGIRYQGQEPQVIHCSSLAEVLRHLP